MAGQKNKADTGKKTSAKKALPAKKMISSQTGALIYLVLAILFFVVTIINQNGIVWKGVHSFIWGVFGWSSVFIPFILLYKAIIMAYDKQGSKKQFISVFLLTVTASTAFTTFFETKSDNYFDSLGELYVFGTKYIGMGIFGGIFAQLFKLLFGSFGARFVSILILCVLAMLVMGINVKSVMDVAKKPVDKVKDINKQYIENKENKLNQNIEWHKKDANFDIEFSDFDEEPVDSDKIIKNKEKKFKQAYENFNDEKNNNPEYISKVRYVGDEIDNMLRTFSNDNSGTSSSRFEKIKTDPLNEALLFDKDFEMSSEERESLKQSNKNESIYDILSRKNEALNNKNNTTEDDKNSVSETDNFNKQVKETQSDESEIKEKTKENMDIPIDIYKSPEIISEDKSDKDDIIDEIENEIQELQENKTELEYHFPPVELLTPPKVSVSDENIMLELQSNGDKLISTLASFNVKAKIVNICRGPSVTRYEIQPAPGVKISKITNLSDDIAMNLAAIGVRIEAPIPGKSAVGVEVPNKTVSMVSMRELIDSDEFRTQDSKLTCVLGKDITGKIFTIDLSTMPHLLIAGTTGSGKSVCVNSILISILYKASPDEVKLILIDPKMVEFSKYKNIPHLLIPVVSDPKKAAGALNWAVNEMLERYKAFSECGTRDIHGYNKLVEETLEFNKLYPDDENKYDADGNLKPTKKMEQIVIAIDELADLMMSAPKEVEDSIFRLAQMARAAGMHLVIATQRPSVDVITGVIKANIPSRIALKVSSPTDSRTILDSGGADKLIGRGDMLCMPVGASKPIRVQGGFASDKEIENITSFIKKQGSADYNETVIEKIDQIAEFSIGSNDKKSSSDDNSSPDSDPLLEDAIKCIVEIGEASVSLLQRKLKIGYARAGRLIDILESMGIVGPSEGSKKRKVLLTYQQWLERNNMIS